MSEDELGAAVAREVSLAYLEEDGPSLFAGCAALRILAIPFIKEALAQKRYAEKMMGHSTGDR